MEQQTTQNPLLELANAIGDIDFAMDELEQLERDILVARSKLTEAKHVAQKVFGPACIEAHHLGHEIPYAYQRCNTLIRFDEESHEVELERLKIGTAYDLKYLLEIAQEASS